MPAAPFTDELVRRLRRGDREVAVRFGGHRSAEITLHPQGLDHPVVLRTKEPDLEAAVTALGADCRDVLWPGHSEESAGFTLLLVHLDEVIATRDTTEPVRIGSLGLEWPRWPRA
ncbi:hypothetical protein [Modestobacter roseus]|uniref:Uncharacterized protein n=1 Tax=Modestobacter roseus TaxID=1181884 RepID=A0A562INV2_9ACTN|nr:hypothetical protein [Modestobacter roseus]MQA35088.1 hypothetical protein [Modestobacter roseus]TWH72661.1 hypothetical protein JD78_01181 [Modestobacter roseus]